MATNKNDDQTEESSRQQAGKVRFKNPADQPEEFSGQVQDTNETALSIATRMWSDTQLRDMNSWQSMIESVQAEGLEVARADEEIGSGFKVDDDKDHWLGIEMMLLEWRFNDGKFENQYGEKTDFVSMVVIGSNNKRAIINDGSTGIAKQLREYSERTGKFGPMYLEDGLRVSRDYPVTLPDGRNILGTTYYIA